VFFFQAEDGIRDRNVTGVQTCALPILISRFRAATHLDIRADRSRRTCATHRIRTAGTATSELRQPRRSARRRTRAAEGRSSYNEIGRASCRERVEIREVGVCVEEKRRE